jgi:hypothetical protein
MRLRSLRLRPRRAASVSERIQHVAVEAAQDAAHKIQRAIIEEIGPMNCRAIDLRREKAGIINVPHIVCWRGRICQGWPSRKLAGLASNSFAIKIVNGASGLVVCRDRIRARIATTSGTLD